MATTRATVLPAQVYARGRTAFPSIVAVPAGMTRATLSCDLSKVIDPAASILVTLDLSLDGGATWYSDTHAFGGYSQWRCHGGLTHPTTHAPVPVSTYSCALPEPGNPNRRLRGSIVIDGPAPAETAVSLDCSDSPLPPRAPASAHHSVAFLASTAANVHVTGVSSFSQAYTLASGGANRCAVARVAWSTTGSGVTVSAITYAGAAMTSVHAALQNTPDNYDSVQLFTLVAPAAGSNTFAVTMSTGLTYDLVADIGCVSGVDQSTPVRPGSYTELAVPNGGPASIVIPSGTSDLTVSVLAIEDSITSSNQTQENVDNGGASIAFATDHATAAGASVTHTWTIGGIEFGGAMAGFSLQAAPPVSQFERVGRGSFRGMARGGR